MSDKLKPCPFCGSSATVYHDEDVGAFVECDNCNARMMTWAGDKEFAASEWNRRAEPERKWIPVSEALPENNRQVLVYAQSTHFALAKYDEMMEPDGKWKKQWVTFDAWKPYYTIENVIAWMPLPEPWRGEE